MCAIHMYWCFPPHLLVFFVTGPSLHRLEGNSLECSVRLSATHHPLCSDLHPSLPDGVHGPFYISRCACGENFNVAHALHCPKGGYTHIRHNDIGDSFANLLNEVCDDFEV